MEKVAVEGMIRMRNEITKRTLDGIKDRYLKEMGFPEGIEVKRIACTDAIELMVRVYDEELRIFRTEVQPLQMRLRKMGWDVKVNMQDYQLTLCGRIGE